MDGQAPPLDAVAREPLAVADELPPPPPLEVEGVLTPGTDGQALPLDAVAPDPLTVSHEPQPRPSPTDEAEDAPPVAPESDTVNAASSGVSEAGTGGVVLTDELRDKIVKQVEYYFSDENLPTDDFMLKCVKKNKKGFVPIETIASFRRMKKLDQELSVIAAALRTSPNLVASSDGKRVRRLHPLPQNELKDPKKSTVLVENLPPDFTMESIHEKFGTVGKVVNITINDPESVKESSTAKKPGFISSSKVHALVEYETVEAAEKATENQHEKPYTKGGRKGRYKGQGQIQQNINKQGSSGSESLNKPIPGPRMPDGTRGFTLGRGRSLPLQKFEKAEE